MLSLNISFCTCGLCHSFVVRADTLEIFYHTEVVAVPQPNGKQKGADLNLSFIGATNGLELFQMKEYAGIKTNKGEFYLMKYWLRGMVLVCIGFLLSACGGKVSTTDGYELVEEGKFIFASSGEYKPFSYMAEDGQMIGFDIDVAEAIAKELDLEPVQQKFKFGSIVEGVKNGRFDAAVASHSITEDRKKEVHFSTPYYYSGAQIFTRSGDTFQTLDDLKDKEIAVSRGSTFAGMIKDVTDNMMLLDSDVTALEALSKGKHDAVVTDYITGKEAIGAGMAIEGKDVLEQSEQGIAVAKENEKLIEKINEILEKLREDGTLKEISEKYFGEDITVAP